MFNFQPPTFNQRNGGQELSSFGFQRSVLDVSTDVCSCTYIYISMDELPLMCRKVFVSLLCPLLFALAGCEKHATTQPSSESPVARSPVSHESGEAKFDVCGLIKNAEIEAVQGSPVTETKSSGHSDGGFRASQCFYAANDNKSVSLAVTQSDPDSPAKRSPRDFWKETFGRYENEEKEREADKAKRESLREQSRSRGEEEERKPPKRIDGVGDEAFWSGSGVGGALYVLKKDKDVFIRISVGGSDNEETRINKSKTLAQKALDRL